MQQEVVLAMLAKEPSHGYQLRARLRQALGPVGDAMNAGQVYVTLTRLEKAGLLAVERAAAGGDRADRKVYALTPAGQQRVAEWPAEVALPPPHPAGVPPKLIRRPGGRPRPGSPRHPPPGRSRHRRSGHRSRRRDRSPGRPRSHG